MMEATQMNGFSKVNITESDIVKRVLNGEKELYEILIRRNNQKLYRIIRSYIKQTAEIEDVMQDTYLKAYKNLHQFRHTSEFSTWLIRIGINEALALIKKKKRASLITDLQQNNEHFIKPQMADTNHSNPEKKLISHEARQLLESTIDLLDTKYRIVYIMREVEGMSMTEISVCLDLTNSNVKVRLHRAKKMLKEKLYESALTQEIFEFGSKRCDHLTERVMRGIG